MSININVFATLNIKRSGYCCIISLIRKNEAIKLIKNTDLTEKKQSIIKHINMKMGKEILTFPNIEIEKKKNFTIKRLLFFCKM